MKALLRVIRLACVIAGIAAFAGPMLAAEDAVLDRGFKPENVYDTHDIDSINLFNGNLTVHLPIGPRFKTNGSLEYGFTLYYNSDFYDYSDHASVNSAGSLHFSKLWTPLDNDGRPDDGYVEAAEAYPNNTMNAGLGWALSMGELYADGSFFWVAPDGAKHVFYPTLNDGSPSAPNTSYTRDGTYIKMTVVQANGHRYHVLHFPDGVRHRFRCIDPCPSNDLVAKYEFNQMADPFGNVLYVRHLSRPASGTWTWTLIEATMKTDPTSGMPDSLYVDSDIPPAELVTTVTEVRTHQMEFDVDNAAYMRLTHLRLAAPGGGFADYAFNYDVMNLYRPYYSTWYGANMIVPFTSAIDDRMRLKVLKSITLPEAAGSWSFSYYEKGTDDPETTSIDETEALHKFEWDPINHTVWWYMSRYSGKLATVSYPTGGKVEYRYGTRTFLQKICHVPGSLRNSFSAVGVTKRQRYRLGAGGVFERDPQGIWLYHGKSYRTQVDENCNVPVEFVSTAIDPFGTATVNYYSTYVGSADGAEPPPWDSREYGLPISKMDPPQGDRWLSTQTYRCAMSSFTERSLDAATFEQRIQYIVQRLRPANVPGTCPDPDRNQADGPLRSTYVKFENSGFLCDPALGASSCLASNRRLARERVVYHDDNGSYADTDSTDFDGLGHYRVQTMSGSGFGGSQTRVERIDYNSGRSITNLPAAWILETYASRKWDENDKRAMALFQFDPNTGFLLSQRSVAATGRVVNNELRDPDTVPNDILRSWSRRRDGDSGTTVILDESSDGGDLATIDGTPEYRTRRKSIYGTESHSEHLTAGGSVVDYDREIDRYTGQVTKEIAASGLTAVYTYDQLGRPTSGTHSGVSDEASLGYEYHAAGGSEEGGRAWVRVSRPAGCTSGCLTHTKHLYDLYGRLFETKSEIPDYVKFNRLQRTYYATGWPATVSTVGLDGQTPSASSFEDYDAFGRVGKIKDPAGHKTTTISYGGVRIVGRKQWGLAYYDPTQDPSQDPDQPVDNTTDPTSQPNPNTFEEYDRHGRLISVSDWSDPGNTNGMTLARYGYDLMNRLTSVDLAGAGSTGTVHQMRTFVYDNRGFLTSETQPEMDGTISYTYDSMGHMRSRTVANRPGLTLTYTYDEAERLTDVTGSGGHPLSHLEYYSRNLDDCGGDAGYAKNRLKSTVRHNYIRNPQQTSQTIDVTVTDAFWYAKGPGWLSKRATTVNRGSLGAPASMTFGQQYQYSPIGLVTSLSYPECAGCPADVVPSRSVANTYVAGLLTAVGGYASRIKYHPNGMFSEVQHTASGGGTGVTDVLVNDPQARTRPQSIYTRGALNADGIHADDWNANGHMAYYYDDFGNIRRIDSVDPNIHSQSDPEYRVYKYDSMSRLRKAVTGAQVNLHQYDRWGNLLASPGAVSPQTNRLTGAEYDPLGNMTRWGNYQYEFDSLNAMTYLLSGDSERMYIYDATGERVGSIDNRVPASTPDGPTGRKESWTIRGTGNQVLRVIENNNGTWSWARDYIYRGASLLASEGPEGTRHFHLDHLGTVRMITDANRRVVSRHVYAPFGEEISNPDSDNESMKFAGHERDNVNAAPLGRVGDLDYMHARFHNPLLGRFLSIDPVGGVVSSSLSWNRYSYVLNNPVSLVDPDGRLPRESPQLPSARSPHQEIGPWCKLCDTAQTAAGKDAAETGRRVIADEGTTCDDSGCTTTVVAPDPAKEPNYGLGSGKRSWIMRRALNVTDFYLEHWEDGANFYAGVGNGTQGTSLISSLLQGIGLKTSDLERKQALVNTNSKAYGLGTVYGIVGIAVAGAKTDGVVPGVKGLDGVNLQDPFWPGMR